MIEFLNPGKKSEDMICNSSKNGCLFEVTLLYFYRMNVDFMEERAFGIIKYWNNHTEDLMFLAYLVIL
jgi:hypothetical protein